MGVKKEGSMRTVVAGREIAAQTAKLGQSIAKGAIWRGKGGRKVKFITFVTQRHLTMHAGVTD